MASHFNGLFFFMPISNNQLTSILELSPPLSLDCPSWLALWYASSPPSSDILLLIASSSFCLRDFSESVAACCTFLVILAFFLSRTWNAVIVERVTLCETEEVREVEELDAIGFFFVLFRMLPMALIMVFNWQSWHYNRLLNKIKCRQASTDP